MIRIGMIGTGRIAKRFLPEARSSGNLAVVGVYNPKQESVNAFSYSNDVTGFYELSELFASVDAVYIASPHETHFEYAKKALMAGKHVLCEKPLCLKEEEAKSLFSLASEKNLVLMEGVKTSYCPGFQKVLELIDSGTIGEVAYVDACFTKLENKTSRELTDEVYGGSFRELGSYVMLPALKIFGCDITSCDFDSVKNEKNIDVFTRGTLRFENGCTANMICGLGVKGDGRLMVSGTKGYILVDAPWWKTKKISVHYEDPSKVDYYECDYLGDGLRYEIAEFLRRIDQTAIKNTVEEPISGPVSTANLGLSEMESITMAKIMETFSNY